MFIVINYSVYLLSLIINGGKTWNALVAVGILLVTVVPLLLLFSFEEKAKKKFPHLIPFLKYLYVCGMGVYVISFGIFCVFLTHGVEYSTENSYDYTIVFGGGIKEGFLSSHAQSRLDAAVSYYNDNKDTVFILSGGVPENERYSEAELMSVYLIKKGVPENNILLESKAKNTWENLVYSFEMIEDGKTVHGISSNYHVKRIELMAKDQGVELDMTASRSGLRFSTVSSYVREYMAYFKYFLGLNNI